jgi:hypothetical protein
MSIEFITGVVSILIAVPSIAIGLFLFFRPGLAINIQIKFYEKINWRIAPVSLLKEIRNTKIMGVFLIVIGLATIVYTFHQIP